MSLLWVLLVATKALLLVSRVPQRGRQAVAGLVWAAVVLQGVMLIAFNAWVVESLPGIPIFFVSPTNLVVVFALIGTCVYLFLGSRFGGETISPRRMQVVTLLLLAFLAIEWVHRTASTAWSRTRRMNHIVFDRYHPQYYEAARWCRDNTPKGALLIGPPYRGGLRSESLRSVFVSWDEQLTFWIAPEYIHEYDRRLRLLGYDPFDKATPQTSWYPARDQILQVQQEYGADYLVIETAKLMAFPIVYQNHGYTVYRIE